MNLLFRVVRVVVWCLFQARLGFLEESRLRFRVWPTDLDFNIHMTNARYLSIMDLGRLDLLLRSGLARSMARHKWQTVLGGTTIRYRRPLKPFQAFELTTRVLCWDDKWFFLEHRVEADGKVAAVAMMRGVFLDGTGTVPPAKVLATLGEQRSSPAFPPHVTAWQGVDLPARP